MMEVVGSVVTTALLVALAVYAWWSIRPPKIRRDDRSRDLGGNAFLPPDD